MEDTSNGPEMQVLQAFFSHVGGFACDRAKDYIEREKESSSRGGGGGVAWASLLSALAHLAATERAYHSMTFLGQKPEGDVPFLLLRWFEGGQSFFSRKDTLRSMYGSLCSELRRVTGSGAQAAAGSGGGNAAVHSEDILGHLAEQLGHLVQSRQEMADLYEKLHGLSLGRHATPGELLASLGAVTQKFSSRVHHPVLSALSSSFQHETEALGHLLRAQRDVSSWLFLPALLELHAAHAKLAAWASRGSERARDGAAAPPQRKPLFGGAAQRVAPTPHLHQWMVKYKTFLLAKFSFYFHEALSRQAGGEMKSLTAKTSPDFFGKVSSFIKKTDAANVSLIFDTRGLEDSFKGHGYHYPGSYPEGLKVPAEGFVPVLSLPIERTAMHWSALSMVLAERSSELACAERVVHAYDEKAQSTYYLARPEPRFTIAVVYESRRSEKDSGVHAFLLETAAALKQSKPFASLKPGSKA
ncbi:KICSTOR subunit 2 isoform X2 [Lethenteron reissneri]|uniref:KICSTOR subunit 2 isoform X2 n=1 Tax=Lethenteron reissneri TaxID=7753 RepID=UPI002AB7C6B4|nr:KICSTOR subunit 2 isoform X2 [Lethenteron reissneri]